MPESINHGDGQEQDKEDCDLGRLLHRFSRFGPSANHIVSARRQRLPVAIFMIVRRIDPLGIFQMLRLRSRDRLTPLFALLP